MIDDLPLEHGDFPYVKLSSRIQKVSYAQHKWSPWTPFDVWSPGPVGTSVVGVLQTTPILWPRISMDFYGFLWISGRLEAHDSSWLIMAIRMIHSWFSKKKMGGLSIYWWVSLETCWRFFRVFKNPLSSLLGSSRFPILHALFWRNTLVSCRVKCQ